MKGQRGWRELIELGEKGNKISGMLEGIIWLFCFFIKKHFYSGVWICGDYLFWCEALK